MQYVYYNFDLEPVNNKIVDFTLHRCGRYNRLKKLAFTTNKYDHHDIIEIVLIIVLSSNINITICYLITCLHVFSSVLWCSLQFPRKIDAQFVITLICFSGFMFHVNCIYLMCPTWFMWYSCRVTVIRLVSIVMNLSSSSVFRLGFFI